MEIRSSVLDCIGNTPLVRLAAASAATGCEILGKAEFMNPGGSIKDRAALGIVRAAEASGELRPGGTIVEGTAGNTGIGIAMVANALGYRTVIVMPDTQSKEKIDTLRAYGADLHLVPAVPYRNPENYVHVSQRLADQLATTNPADSSARSGPAVRWPAWQVRCARANPASALHCPIQPDPAFITTTLTGKSGSRAIPSPRASATAG